MTGRPSKSSVIGVHPTYLNIITEIFIVVGVLVLSIGLRTFRPTWLRKLGALGFLAVTFLVGWFIADKIWVGVACVGSWFLLPWIELLTRTRKLRLPVKKELLRRPPPSAQKFPELREITESVEQRDFEYASDNGWEWSGVDQFFRLFYRAHDRMEAAICFTEQDSVSWVCFTLTTRLQNGRVYRTTNLPFSHPMKTLPNIELRQSANIEDFAELLAQHEAWIKDLSITADQCEPAELEDMSGKIENETLKMIRHNLEKGVIALSDKVSEKGETFRYSWRGLFFVYFQLIKDLVRWC
ncbi:MAG: hypothetical protein AAF226_14025 [Verrucomicrobiota bacterium]